MKRVVVERDGELEEYSADVVVVAGGAINSAALLLRRRTTGIPTASATAPASSAGTDAAQQLFADRVLEHAQPDAVPEDAGHQRLLLRRPRATGDYPLGAMQMLGQERRRAVGFDVPDADDPADLARHSIDFWLTTEDLPLPDNRVTVDPDGSIRLSYTPTNLEAHDRLREKFMGLLDTMRCRNEVYGTSSYPGGQLGIAGVAHQNGTIRFGSDPRRPRWT